MWLLTNFVVSGGTQLSCASRCAPLQEAGKTRGSQKVHLCGNGQSYVIPTWSLYKGTYARHHKGDTVFTFILARDDPGDHLTRPTYAQHRPGNLSCLFLCFCPRIPVVTRGNVIIVLGLRSHTLRSPSLEYWCLLSALLWTQHTTTEPLCWATLFNSNAGDRDWCRFGQQKDGFEIRSGEIFDC